MSLLRRGFLASPSVASLCSVLIRGPSWGRLLATSANHMSQSKSPPFREEGITTSKGGDIICCWHPEPKYPYELSKPISRNDVKVNGTLKSHLLDDTSDLYHYTAERLQRRELMRLTWTTKHRWFPNFGRNERIKQAARKNPREKPFL
uniref:Large ribosomal subunit protein mL42 n=1 Tax=Pseudodiaptomus poplesia TaxID=213370 RepID=A0A0U2UTI7_9MAXI|nr:mitochondrial 28S ribosomal protein L42 [Pseudodiaptomus poplesia]